MKPSRGWRARWWVTISPGSGRTRDLTPRQYNTLWCRGYRFTPSTALAVELQSYGCAPCEAFAVESWINGLFHHMISDIFGPLVLRGYLPRVTTQGIANNYLWWIAGYNRACRGGLPSQEIGFSGDGHGQDNELDTYRVAQLGLDILSSILRYLKGNINASCSNPFAWGCQKPDAHFSIEDKYGQDPNTINRDVSKSQPRDLTAYWYTKCILRRRNLHTSSLMAGTKVSSRTSPARKNHVSNTKGDGKLNSSNSSYTTTSVGTWLQAQLDKFRKGDGGYYGVVNILTNLEYLKLIYLEIKSKSGNMYPGLYQTTLDDINEKWFTETANGIRTGRFKFTPGRRVFIPQPGKKERRSLGVVSPCDKVVQKALAILLEAIWEPKFLDRSYGFRPKRSLHQALYEIYRNGSSYNWVIQGDISKCFDKIPHAVILKVVGTHVKCEKTIQLIRKFLTAGLIDLQTGKIASYALGIPQGGILSSLLSNIVLNELDVQMEKIKQRFDKGAKRARNPQYEKLTSKIQSLEKFHPGSPDIARLARLRKSIPSTNTHDPNFKRMMYLRYADDFVILVIGSSSEANDIRNQIADILDNKCGLELNKDKTLITAVKDGFYFLGAHCIKTTSLKVGLFTNSRGKPSKNRMRMRVSASTKKLLMKLRENKLTKLNELGIPTPTARRDLINLEHHEIITFYNHKIQGLLSFYRFASNLHSLGSIFSMLHLSCALTLALKYKLRTKKQVFKRFGRYLEDPDTQIKINLPNDLKVKHRFNF